MRGTQYRPRNTVILIMGNPEMVPLILGKLPYMYVYIYIHEQNLIMHTEGIFASNSGAFMIRI